MTAAEYERRVNEAETVIERLTLARLELLKDIVACLSKVVDAIPDQT
jgi:hypothetical protein